ncbi:MAG: class II fumarate hydratase [Absicoccus porci]|uniref:class II fumarate hydratase n=1 Tax=Absicoccus porci TaxID=2486576 RepID=UPI002409BAFD|nr:class II fumarate hydratase [Absicoccus porci]MDD6460246.1 class II fumarate hydratase [Absicoccus porci]
MTSYRIEHDSMGEMKVPQDALWGAQTQRSKQNFKIGQEKMPQGIIEAFAILKKGAALTNKKLGKLDSTKCQLIQTVCDEILAGKWNDQFPLVVWQTGSGTQSNMNVNEVIANRGNQIANEKLLHPNDTINMSQSSNDTFPTALHIAAVRAITYQLFPAMDHMIQVLDRLEKENRNVIKSGRTHLQDAVPVGFGQEISGWKTMIIQSKAYIQSTLPYLSQLALGGTAVGTGLNAPKEFGEEVAKIISQLTGLSFTSEPNKFHALSSKDAIAFSHGALKALAADLMKIANDVRWMASGPRLGLGEIIIPANEPGSSIMPGKVNPTQCEAVTMVAVQVMGNDTTIGVAASQGNFELNVFMPVIAYNFLQSVGLLADCMKSFTDNCLVGIKANKEKMDYNLKHSLMLVTALNPYIGYEKAAQTSNLAFKENISLKEAVVKLGYMTADEFDAAVQPEKMI